MKNNQKDHIPEAGKMVTAVDILWNEINDYKFNSAKAVKIAHSYYKAKQMEQEQKKQELIGLLNWMNKVAETNPMAFETDAEDIVEMYLN